MRKIQLVEGVSGITKRNVKPETETLMKSIVEKCSKSGLSYVEINKALYLADGELYKTIINAPRMN